MAQETTKVTIEQAGNLFNKNIISNEMATVIGQVVVSWTMLETYFLMLLDTMVGIDAKILAMMVAETTFLQKINMVTSMMHHSRKSEWFHEWDGYEKRIEILRTKRNDIVHGHWGITENGAAMTIRVKSRRKLTPERRAREIDELKQFTVDILSLLLELNVFREKLKAEGVQATLTNPQGPVLDRTQSPKAQAQNQARAQKDARRQKPQGPKRSAAQKRALREANQEKDA